MNYIHAHLSGIDLEISQGGDQVRFQDGSFIELTIAAEFEVEGRWSVGLPCIVYKTHLACSC